MKHSLEQVMKGLVNYADAEVMGKLPTSGKWVVGTMMSVAVDKFGDVTESLKHNTIVNMLDIIDEDDMVDTDVLLNELKHSAEKYGNLSLDIPMVGSLTFSAQDIERLKTYML